MTHHRPWCKKHTGNLCHSSKTTYDFGTRPNGETEQLDLELIANPHTDQDHIQLAIHTATNYCPFTLDKNQRDTLRNALAAITYTSENNPTTARLFEDLAYQTACPNHPDTTCYTCNNRNSYRPDDGPVSRETEQDV